MSLLASLRPLLRGAASIEVVLYDENGTLTALIKPKLLKVDEDTTDPELAKLQAALSRPLKLGLTSDDPDAELATALDMMAKARVQNQDALQRYAEDQQQAGAAAEIERQKKAETASKKPADSGKPGGKAKTTKTSGSDKPASSEAAPLPQGSTGDGNTNPDADAPAVTATEGKSPSATTDQAATGGDSSQSPGLFD